jgi:hypothetical protein
MEVVKHRPNSNSQGGETLACNFEIRCVSLSGKCLGRQGSKGGEKLSTARTQVEEAGGMRNVLSGNGTVVPRGVPHLPSTLECGKVPSREGGGPCDLYETVEFALRRVHTLTIHKGNITPTQTMGLSGTEVREVRRRRSLKAYLVALASTFGSTQRTGRLA